MIRSKFEKDSFFDEFIHTAFAEGRRNLERSLKFIGNRASRRAKPSKTKRRFYDAYLERE